MSLPWRIVFTIFSATGLVHESETEQRIYRQQIRAASSSQTKRTLRYLRAAPFQISVTLTFCLISIFCQIHQELEELFGLANKETHCCQEPDCSHGNAFGFSWSNDRTHRQLSTEERTRLRHDQICLKSLPAEGRRVEIREYQPICWVSERS